MTQPTSTHATSDSLTSAGLYGLGAAAVTAVLGLFSLFLGMCVFSICSYALGAAVWIAEEIGEGVAARKRAAGPAANSSNKTTPSDDRKPGALAKVTSPTADFTRSANSSKPPLPAHDLVTPPPPALKP